MEERPSRPKIEQHPAVPDRTTKSEEKISIFDREKLVNATPEKRLEIYKLEAERIGMNLSQLMQELPKDYRFESPEMQDIAELVSSQTKKSGIQRYFEGETEFIETQKDAATKSRMYYRLWEDMKRKLSKVISALEEERRISDPQKIEQFKKYLAQK